MALQGPRRLTRRVLLIRESRSRWGLILFVLVMALAGGGFFYFHRESGGHGPSSGPTLPFLTPATPPIPKILVESPLGVVNQESNGAWTWTFGDAKLRLFDWGMEKIVVLNSPRDRLTCKVSYESSSPIYRATFENIRYEMKGKDSVILEQGHLLIPELRTGETGQAQLYYYNWAAVYQITFKLIP